MKILIFAGGTGTRLWPLSRKNSPKQFGQIFNGKSTLQIIIGILEKEFGLENLFLSTNESYVEIIKRQIPNFPTQNIVTEPEKRDLAAAIGYNFMRLQKTGYRGPVAIVWADLLISRGEELIKAFLKGAKLIKENPDRLVFLAEKPRFANHNLGWIHRGKRIKEGVYEFLEWHYRPSLSRCQEILASGQWDWNSGYFVVDLETIVSLYKKLMPEMYSKLKEIVNNLKTMDELRVLKEIYPTLESISFDDAIIQKVSPEKAVVLPVEMGWSDPGTLYALKESFVKKEAQNHEEGLVYTYETQDSLIVNEDKEKLVTVIGGEGMIVVNTKDALLVVNKESVPMVKKLVGELKKDKELKKYI